MAALFQSLHLSVLYHPRLPVSNRRSFNGDRAATPPAFCRSFCRCRGLFASALYRLGQLTILTILTAYYFDRLTNKVIKEVALFVTVIAMTFYRIGHTS
jgi:hypothetical protein